MVFSSLIFLFVFLPIVLAIYYAIPLKMKNIFLLIASFLFFAWGGVGYSLILVTSLLINYFFGLLLDFIGKKSEKKKKIVLVAAVILNLGILVVFKYLSFIIENINSLLELYNINNETYEFLLIINPNIILPIGISFYTFQALSYLIDVYRGNTPVQRNFIKLSLYISLFPQLIAGPIVRYHDINLQLDNRKHSLKSFSNGVERFIIGLGKKILLANTFALVVDQIFLIPTELLPTSLAWLGIVLYALQIYFDFSGYSDMAIGLGLMFGFKFLENFNFPYIASSIQDFWRRWHISLSSWFRDYLYISLGGNRGGAFNTYKNLIIVFFVTGLWHGASWNFVIWGLIHGLFLLIERILGEQRMSKIPKLIRHAYLLFIVLITWVFFRAEDLHTSILFIKSMLGLTNVSNDMLIVSQYLDKQLLIMFVIAILGSFGVIERMVNLFKSKSQNALFILVNQSIYSLSLIFIIILCYSSLAGNTYNPFIYFRF